MPNQRCPLCQRYVPLGETNCFRCGFAFGGWLVRFERYRIPFFSFLLSSLFTLGLFYLGELLREQHRAMEQAKQNDQAILALKNELSQNFSNSNNIRTILTEDLTKLQKSETATPPLVNFQFAAWEYTRFGRADFLSQAQTKDYMKLQNAYLVLHILEAKFMIENNTVF